MNKLSKRAKIILTVVVALMTLAVGLTSQWRMADKMEIVFLDVGQGDAVLIKTGGGKNILIDGGPDKSVVYGLGRHLAFYERTIDLVVLTHPDSDHVVGLVEVLKRYQVKQILLTVKQSTAPEYPAWRRAVENEGAKVILAQAGQVFDFDPETRMTVLYPFDEAGLNDLPPNDTSVVTRLEHGDNSWLLTGDLPEEIEEKILARLNGNTDILQVDVLKVGHHGSKYSSRVDFLRAVQPEMAVISVGEKNRFNHPAYAALDRLRRIGAQILRTDQLGDICMVSDGARIAPCR